MKKILTTDRLILRELTTADAAQLYKLDNDPQVMKYIGSYHGQERSLEDCEGVVERQREYYKKHPGLGIWATILKKDHSFIGWTTLKYLDATQQVELGYRYLPEFWNQGYATEMCTSLVTYGFETLGLNEIVAVAQPQNIASIRVMEKVGMSYVKEDIFYHSQVVYYRMTQDSIERDL